MRINTWYHEKMTKNDSLLMRDGQVINCVFAILGEKINSQISAQGLTPVQCFAGREELRLACTSDSSRTYPTLSFPKMFHDCRSP